jgi:multicomponent Na+:H+ antiporter subunit G
MTLLDWASTVAMLTGSFFFGAGTIGVLRFPDATSRLHAVTKADNLGLGLLVLGLILRAQSPWVGVKLVIIWALVLVASTTISQLIAAVALASIPSPAQELHRNVGGRLHDSHHPRPDGASGDEGR